VSFEEGIMPGLWVQHVQAPTRTVGLPRAMFGPSPAEWLEDWLGQTVSCVACGGPEALALVAPFGDVRFCDDCLVLASTPAEDLELGGSD
jgi:hypothetical protein